MTARIIVGDALTVMRTLPAPKSSEWHEAWLREAQRVVVPDGPFVVFGSRRYFDVLMGAMRKVLGDTRARPLQTGVWVHRQGHAVASGMLRPEHEPFVCSGKLRTTAPEVRKLRSYVSPCNVARKPVHRRAPSKGFGVHTYVPDADGPMAGTIIEAARNKPAEKVGHPTQKAEAVMVPPVLWSSEPGGLVLDPFAGSGTTGVVAVRHGRQFVGIELSPTYAEMARKRIASEQDAVLAAMLR